MWQKGALVIVKRSGDQKMADAMIDGLNQHPLPLNQSQSEQLSSSDTLKRIKELEAENYFLKKRLNEIYQQKMSENQMFYGYNWAPPKWANKIISLCALIIYGFSVFVDKYLVIKN